MFEKVAVGLDMEKQALEKECNQFQVSLLCGVTAACLIHRYAVIRMNACEKNPNTITCKT